MRTPTILLLGCLLLTTAATAQRRDAASGPVRLLATRLTSTLEREMNQAADAGYRFTSVTAGRTGSDDEVVALMTTGAESGRYRYRVLNAALNPFAQIQSAARDGFEYRAHTSRIESSGERLLFILEKDTRSTERWEYVVRQTSRTSTMEKEVAESLAAGYTIVDSLFTARTRVGEADLLVVMRRPAK